MTCGSDSHCGSLGAVNRMTNMYFQLLLSSKQALFSPPSLSVSPLISAASTFIRAKSERISLMPQDMSANGRVELKTEMEMIGRSSSYTLKVIIHKNKYQYAAAIDDLSYLSLTY